MSDEHNPKMLGCYGHDKVQTPNLDRLAKNGTRFTAAYTNSPICIPARASFATGRYPHATRCWDNAMPYEGNIRGWGHHLLDEGVRVESIGKLHYRNEEADTGFARQHHPMHVMDGIGQVWGSVRDPLPETRAGKMLNEIGPGESNYNRYDNLIAEEACKWLKQSAATPANTPWVLYVGFVAPHFPLVVPEEFYSLYPLDALPARKLDPLKGYKQHPWIERMDNFSQVDRHLTAEQRKMATAAYFGLCTFVDYQIGRVIDTLMETGLDKDTRIIYTSDHGDNVGARGLWGKSNMYEEAAGIPLITVGADVPEGKVCRTPVTLVDAYQTILQGCGFEQKGGTSELPGRSWFDIACETDDLNRISFSEYHAAGSPSGAFMIRKGRYKFIYYAGYEPELFDLRDDPEELVNLADDKAYRHVVEEYNDDLRGICDPDKIDRQAKDDQNSLIERFGGRERALHSGTPGATPAPGQGHE